MEAMNFQQALENLKDTGFNPVPNVVNIGVPDAKNNLWRGISYFSKQPVWLPEYDEIVAWLTSNDGRGLFCYGNCGLGKTLICGKVIPVLLNYYCHKIVSCYDAQQMNANLDAVKSRHIIYIDDIGTENLSVKYGEKRLAFSEIVDEAEKRGKLLIVTTNLSLNEVSEKYGERTMDRLVAITKRVNFIGKSLRK
jgi:DNA replication protein DnaC